MTIDEFYKNHLGMGVDKDKAYGIQCVDLFKCFTDEFFGVSDYNCGNGLASGLWLNRKSRPYYQFFEEVSVNNMQNGDWVIWDRCKPDTPNTHVAMYYNGKFFGQNQKGIEAATLTDVSRNGILGVLRPKLAKIKYRAHIGGVGWQEWKSDGQTAGTTGQGKRLEAIQIDFDEPVTAKAHLQDHSWVDYGTITKDTVIGTTGESRRLEDLCLKGNFKYRVHVAGTGWTQWTNADGIATLGTVGQSKAIEAIEIIKN